MNLFKKNMLIGGLSVALAALSGCAAMNTEINHGSLQTNTKMSNTIFLPPFPEDEKLVFVTVKNTSDQDVQIQNLLERDLQQKGYTIVSDPSQADAILQINILQAGKTTQSAVNAAFTDGFGGTFLGGTAVGGIAGAAVSSADPAVKDVVYSMITDMQISAKVPDGIMTVQTTTADFQQGSETTVPSESSVQPDMQLYQARIVSTADKTNLNFNDVKPTLEINLANEIANIF